MKDASYQVGLSHGSLDCITCHSDESGLQDAHVNVTASDTDGTRKLKKTEVSNDACLSCHEADYNPEATADITALTDSNGTKVNPHGLPSTSQHETAFACTNCHAMHTDRSIEDEAKAYCKSCHHKDVYECNTCHEL